MDLFSFFLVVDRFPAIFVFLVEASACCVVEVLNICGVAVL